MMKKISIVIPTFNEAENVTRVSQAVVAIFEKELSKYDYEVIFIDNDSTDGTRDLIITLCQENKKIKAIFNARNFGWMRSPFYGLLQAQGDCAIMLAADFQDPPELIPQFVQEWEKGYKIVSGIKKNSMESKLMFFIRSCFYAMIKKISDVEQIEHFTGFGLYDKQFLNVLRALDDPMPYMRGIVAELGFRRKDVEYLQPRREMGKSKSSWYRLYDVGMLGVTSYSKVLLRIATIAGFFFSALSLLVALIYLILKLCFWNVFAMGTAPILMGVFVFSSIQLFFIGLLGEYILTINTRIMKRPLVIEEKRIGF